MQRTARKDSLYRLFSESRVDVSDVLPSGTVESGAGPAGHVVPGLASAAVSDEGARIPLCLSGRDVVNAHLGPHLGFLSRKRLRASSRVRSLTFLESMSAKRDPTTARSSASCSAIALMWRETRRRRYTSRELPTSATNASSFRSVAGERSRK